MARYLINEVIGKGDGTPMLMTFQNGYPTDAVQQEPCTVLQDKETGSNTYITEIDGMLYNGTELKDDNVGTMIVVRNKVTGTVRVVESGYIDMKPWLQHDVENRMDTTSNLALSRKFGSKKHKQKMEQREKMKVNVETVTEQMLKVTEEIKPEQVDLSSYTTNDAEDFYVPPINRTAQCLEDVYDIEKILTEEEYNKIYSQLEGKDYSSDLIPWLQSLVANKSLPPKHTVLIVYANCLLNLYNTVAREIGKKAFTACPFSTTLNEVILKHFVLQTHGKLLRPGPYKDKALCYAMVLILLVNNFKFDLDGFCQALKLTVKNATMKVRTTGATVVNNGGKKVVQLKIPLNTKSGFRRKSTKF